MLIQSQSLTARPPRNEAKFFGRLFPSGILRCPFPPWYRSLKMMATAIAYTRLGFAIAADGRQRWEHAPTRDRSTREAESNTVQKVFEIAGKQAVLAYVVRGHVANRDRSFDLGVELKNQIALLRDKHFRNCRQFLEALSVKLERYIETAKEDGRIEEYAAAELSFVGYFDGEPCWIDIQFRPFRDPMTGSHWAAASRDLYPGLCIASGSQLVREMISQGDPRFAQFWKPFEGELSLQEAADFARGYIEACCSPLARELDPDCSGIGGHIHVATVSPTDRSLAVPRWLGFKKRALPTGGFRWLTPPS